MVRTQRRNPYFILDSYNISQISGADITPGLILVLKCLLTNPVIHRNFAAQRSRTINDHVFPSPWHNLRGGFQYQSHLSATHWKMIPQWASDRRSRSATLTGRNMESRQSNTSRDHWLEQPLARDKTVIHMSQRLDMRRDVPPLWAVISAASNHLVITKHTSSAHSRLFIGLSLWGSYAKLLSGGKFCFIC